MACCAECKESGGSCGGTKPPPPVDDGRYVQRYEGGAVYATDDQGQRVYMRTAGLQGQRPLDLEVVVGVGAMLYGAWEGSGWMVASALMMTMFALAHAPPPAPAPVPAPAGDPPAGVIP